MWRNKSQCTKLAGIRTCGKQNEVMGGRTPPKLPESVQKIKTVGGKKCQNTTCKVGHMDEKHSFGKQIANHQPTTTSGTLFGIPYQEGVHAMMYGCSHWKASGAHERFRLVVQILQRTRWLLHPHPSQRQPEKKQIVAQTIFFWSRKKVAKMAPCWAFAIFFGI